MKFFFSTILAFFSAIAAGFGSALQAKSAQENSQSHNTSNQTDKPHKQGDQGKPEDNHGHLYNTIRSMCKPLFIAGTLCNVIGFIANAGADRLGELFFVQPISATHLLFAAIFGVFLLHTKITKQSCLSMILIIAGTAPGERSNKPIPASDTAKPTTDNGAKPGCT